MVVVNEGNVPNDSIVDNLVESYGHNVFLIFNHMAICTSSSFGYLPSLMLST